MEVELLSDLQLAGLTLDVGGGRNSSYQDIIPGYEGFHSMNISPSQAPRVIADANKPFPIRDCVYDNVFSANTLEHLVADEHVMRECFRVLKSRGRFVTLVPFLFAVHGSPMDFHRHTAEYWEHLLQRLGALDIRIEPLVWSPLVTALSLLERFRGFKRLTRLAILLSGHSPRYAGSDPRLGYPLAELHSRYPMGYYIQATKPG
jgi:SAM-dependent methyltransferase